MISALANKMHMKDLKPGRRVQFCKRSVKSFFMILVILVSLCSAVTIAGCGGGSSSSSGGTISGSGK